MAQASDLFFSGGDHGFITIQAGSRAIRFPVVQRPLVFVPPSFEQDFSHGGYYP